MAKSSRPVVLVQPHCSFDLEGPSALNTEFDSLGLLALAAFMRARGRDTQVIHFARGLAQGLTPAALFDRVVALDPVVIGISINWLHLSQGAMEIARVLRERLPGVPVVVGGQHASHFAADIMEHHHDLFDGVAVGEAEETLDEVTRRAAGGEPLTAVPGLMTFDGSEATIVPRRVTLQLEALPYISYEVVFPAATQGPPALAAALDTTRGGCRKDCNYCLESSTLGHLGRTGSQAHTAERLVEQVKRNVAEGRDWITIQDQLFTHGGDLMVAFVEGLIEAKVKLKHLSVFLEPGCYPREVYDVLERAPAEELALSFGVETGSPKVAKNLRRFHDYDRIRDELSDLGQRRYVSSTWWMVGLPEETAADVALTRQMILDTMEMGIYPRWVTPLILFPQTDLARETERFQITPLLRSFDDFTVFSRTPQNDYGAYPDLITHESAFQSKQETLDHVVALKQTIEENYAALEERHAAHHGATSFSQFRRASFF